VSELTIFVVAPCVEKTAFGQECGHSSFRNVEILDIKQTRRFDSMWLEEFSKHAFAPNKQLPIYGQSS
jgi:hypothetical protein